MRLGPVTRLSLQTRGRLVIAVVTFALDPDAVIDAPDGLSRAIGATLAEVAISVAPPSGAEGVS